MLTNKRDWTSLDCFFLGYLKIQIYPQSIPEFKDILFVGLVSYNHNHAKMSLKIVSIELQNVVIYQILFFVYKGHN